MKQSHLSRKYQRTAGAEAAPPAPAPRRQPVINLTIGDPDQTTDPIITRAAFEDVLAGYTHYAHPLGDPELRDGICRYYLEEYGMSIGRDNVLVTAAGNVAMYLAMQALLDPGDEVIVATPCFFVYFEQIRMAGGIPVEVPTFAENGFRLEAARMEAAVTQKTKAILFNTPCNPTGMCYDRAGLEAVADIARRHDLAVVADDIYTALSFETPFVPIASLEGMEGRTVTINSFSKNFTMAGWRIGNIVAPSDIIRALGEVNDHVVFGAPMPSQRAALHALRNREAIVPKIVELYRERVNYAFSRIEEIPGLKAVRPQGTFYLFPDIRGSGLSSDAVVARLAEEGVLVKSGADFGESGEGYVRISCTVGIEALKEAFDRIAQMPEFQ